MFNSRLSEEGHMGMNLKGSSPKKGTTKKALRLKLDLECRVRHKKNVCPLSPSPVAKIQLIHF